MTTLYETDVYLWVKRQVELLRAEDFEHVDWNNLIEEIDSVGIEQLHAIQSHTRQLLAHLLKWQYQPEKRQTGASWQSTIIEQRASIQDRLATNRSLAARYDVIARTVYPKAVRLAAAETGLHVRIFPAECPWSADQILDEEFWPEGN